MATLERTAYPRLPEVLAPRELQACYTPLPDELEWARRSTRDERPRLGLLVLLKVFQHLHYSAPGFWAAAVESLFADESAVRFISAAMFANCCS